MSDIAIGIRFPGNEFSSIEKFRYLARRSEFHWIDHIVVTDHIFGLTPRRPALDGQMPSRLQTWLSTLHLQRRVS